MIEPREDFQKQHGKGWQDVVDSAQFIAAAKAAMLEMQQKVAFTPDTVNAAAAHWAIKGAQQYLSILMGLMAPEAKRPPGPTQNLKHDLK